MTAIVPIVARHAIPAVIAKLADAGTKADSETESECGLKQMATRGIIICMRMWLYRGVISAESGVIIDKRKLRQGNRQGVAMGKALLA